MSRLNCLKRHNISNYLSLHNNFSIKLTNDHLLDNAAMKFQ